MLPGPPASIGGMSAVSEDAGPGHRTVARQVFTIVNRSAAIPDADVEIMHSAIALILPIVAEVWGRDPPELRLADDRGPPPAGSGDRCFCLVDQRPAPADELPGCSYVCAQAVLQNGGASLWAKTKPTVASVLFREMARALTDPDCDSWWKGPDGVFHAADIVGPVQGQILGIFLNHGNSALTDAPRLAPAHNAAARRPYTFVPAEGPCPSCPNTGPVVVNGNPLISVGLSDFLYPAWCDPEAKREARFSYTGFGNLRPFQASEAGYSITTSGEGQSAVVYGKSVPEWLRKTPEHVTHLRARGCRHEGQPPELKGSGP